MGSRSRRWLNQSTYSRVAYSTWSRSFHAFVDEFCLVQTNDGFGEGVVVGISSRGPQRIPTLPQTRQCCNDPLNLGCPPASE